MELASLSEQISQWTSILTLVVFVLANVAVVFPAKISIPPFVVLKATQTLSFFRIVRRGAPLQQFQLHLNFITVPLISVLILLAAGCITGTEVRRGILGADGVKPIDIMALFISLAYLSISLDATGLLRFSAFWVAKKGGTSGKRLYLYLYVFFLVCGVVVGNDPVILSGTLFLAYLTKISGIDPPTAWIFAQFSAANMASVVLVSSNPTNLVISGAFAAAAFVFPALLVLFRSPRLIPRTLVIGGAAGGDAIDPRSALVDRNGAIFGVMLLIATLGVLVGTSTIHVPVWQVTVPPAVIMLCRDIYHDWSDKSLQVTDKHVQTLPETPKSAELGLVPQPEDAHFPPQSNLRRLIAVAYYDARFPTVMSILRRLPIPLLPFAFLMFILVQGLSTKGWVEVLAKGWAWWTRLSGPVGAVAGMGFVSCLLCNICGTNIGATILAARVLQIWISEAGPDLDPKLRDASIYALAIGSNFGAFTFTFAASLAGLLWRDILRQKGIIVRQWQFCKLNLLLVLVAMVAASAVLVGELYVIHGRS